MVRIKKEIVMEETYIPTEQEQQEAYETHQALSALPTIIERKEVFKRGIKEQVLSGYMNPLEFYRQAKIIVDCMEDLKKDAEIFECATSERLKYGKEKPVINGSVIDMSSRTTYDYKTCNDPVWNSLQEQIKEREKLLKALPKEGMTVTDKDSGETITIYRPSEKVSEFITVKI